MSNSKSITLPKAMQLEFGRRPISAFQKTSRAVTTVLRARKAAAFDSKMATNITPRPAPKPARKPASRAAIKRKAVLVEETAAPPVLSTCSSKRIKK
jgi:hypothetical protein